MKNLPLHAFYLIIIGILSFQLWSKTTVDNRAFEQVEKVLEEDFRILSGTAENLTKEIVNAVRAYPKPENLNFLKEIQAFSRFSQEKKVWIDQKILAIKEGKTVSPTEINNALKSHNELILKIAVFAGTTGEAQNFGLQKMIDSDTFQRGLESKPIVFLLMLQNQIQNDKINFFIYVKNRMNWSIDTDASWGRIKVCIAPKKAVLFEGEKFEADIFLAQYLGMPNDAVTITSEKEILPLKDGVSHCSKVENTIGLKIFQAEAKIKNPFTGQETISRGQFEYNVIPKCRQNCQ